MMQLVSRDVIEHLSQPRVIFFEPGAGPFQPLYRSRSLHASSRFLLRHVTAQGIPRPASPAPLVIPGAAGEKVTLWYTSANKDEATFTDRWTFDVRRDPNPHLGYGGGGVHFCLGANLARREITVVSDELHRQIPDIAATEEPAGLLSAFVHGIKRLPVAWTPPR